MSVGCWETVVEDRKDPPSNRQGAQVELKEKGKNV
jgi:hypothetical protein